MNQLLNETWNDFLKSGSIDSYLKYTYVKSQCKDVAYATDTKGSCNKREQLR